MAWIRDRGAATIFEDRQNCIKFTWGLELCRSNRRGGEGEQPFFSPVFNAVGERRWRVLFCPEGVSDATKDYCSLFLYYETSNKDNGIVHPGVKYKFTLLDAKHKPVYQCRSDFIHWEAPAPGRRHGFEKFIKQDDVSVVFWHQDDSEILVFVCCHLYDDGKFITRPLSKVSEDYKTMFHSQNFGDTIIQASDGKEFRVYRGILQARSPVFAAMFQHDMKEKKQGRVVIADVKSTVVKEMLTYIYTGSAPNLNTMAKELLPIADRYDLGELKVMCGAVLAKNLTRENANEIFLLADLHGVKELRGFVENCTESNSFVSVRPRVRRKSHKAYFEELMFWLKLVGSIPFVVLFLIILYHVVSGILS